MFLSPLNWHYAKFAFACTTVDDDVRKQAPGDTSPSTATQPTEPTAPVEPAPSFAVVEL